jgi:transcriptional regulator with XRE-family HTH domain
MQDAPNDTPKTLGAYIRAARDQANLSRVQLATAIGVDPSYIARIESGERAKPGADVLQRIADTLGIDAGELLAFLGVRLNLPEPQVYFQAKYGMSADEAGVVTHLVEQFLVTGQA